LDGAIPKLRLRLPPGAKAQQTTLKMIVTKYDFFIVNRIHQLSVGVKDI